MKQLVLLVTLLMLAIPVAWAEENPQNSQPPAEASTNTENPESQQLAQLRIMEMANFLATTEKFSFSIRAGYDVVQDNGQKIEFGEIRNILVQRPDLVRIEEKASDGANDLMVFDGKQISMFNSDNNVFAQAPQPGDIDTTVVYFVRDLQMRLPLAPLLMNQLPKELEQRIVRVDAVEITELFGQSALHVAGQTKTVDFQIWIAEGEQPLPLRMVLSYRQENEHPQFWADFSEWNLSPQIDAQTFTFNPPADAAQIMFAAQFQPAVSDMPQDQIEPQGGKK